MKVKEITVSTIEYVKMDDGFYRRYSPDDWFIEMGEVFEPVFLCEELEQVYQNYKHSEGSTI